MNETKSFLSDQSVNTNVLQPYDDKSTTEALHEIKFATVSNEDLITCPVAHEQINSIGPTFQDASQTFSETPPPFEPNQLSTSYECHPTIFEPEMGKTFDTEQESNVPDQSKTRMTIIPATVLAQLRADAMRTKEFNTILRSHNLSLARQNAMLRKQLAEVEAFTGDLRAERGQFNDSSTNDKSAGQPSHYRGGAHQTIPQDLVLRTELDRERQTVSLLHDCCLEWARLEQQLEEEKAMLQNQFEGEVTEYHRE